MKTTSKLIGSVLALIIVILAIFLVTKFNSHESARVGTVKSSVRTSQTTSSSSRKTNKKNNKSSQTSSSVASNEENDNQASAVAPKTSSQEQAQAGATEIKLKALYIVGKLLILQLEQIRLKLRRGQIIVNHHLTSAPLIMVILALLWELGLMRVVNQLQLTLMVQ